MKKRKLRWIGHTLREPPTNITRQALTWNPQGKRKMRRPRNTCRRDLEAGACQTGYTWNPLRGLAKDRTRWRSTVDGLYPQRADGPK